jgi:hypothetical protein
MSGSALTIELPLGTFLTLGPEAVDAFEGAIRKQRRADRMKRGLAAEIEVFLTAGPATAPEIARSIGARDSSVRQLLQTDALFTRAPTTAGHSPRAKLWSMACSPSGPGPTGRTSTRSEDE